jgi:hypothetical protein
MDPQYGPTIFSRAAMSNAKGKKAIICKNIFKKSF